MRCAPALKFLLWKRRKPKNQRVFFAEHGIERLRGKFHCSLHGAYVCVVREHETGISRHKLFPQCRSSRGTFFVYFSESEKSGVFGVRHLDLIHTTQRKEAERKEDSSMHSQARIRRSSVTQMGNIFGALLMGCLRVPF